MSLVIISRRVVSKCPTRGDAVSLWCSTQKTLEKHKRAGTQTLPRPAAQQRPVSATVSVTSGQTVVPMRFRVLRLAQHRTACRQQGGITRPVILSVQDLGMREMCFTFFMTFCTRPNGPAFAPPRPPRIPPRPRSDALLSFLDLTGWLPTMKLSLLSPPARSNLLPNSRPNPPMLLRSNRSVPLTSRSPKEPPQRLPIMLPRSGICTAPPEIRATSEPLFAG